MSYFYTVEKEAVAELTEKKSRFIATVRPVTNENEALGFVEEMKKKYWDARHNCSAYVILNERVNEKQEAKSFVDIEKANDDGEPSKTAGSPILEAIRGAQLKNVAIVVTRYFGGILLGTGGLVRAYGGAAALGIEASKKVKMGLLNKIQIVTDYNSFGKLKNKAESMGVDIVDVEYTDKVLAVCLCDDSALGMISGMMKELTAGKCRIEQLDRNYFKSLI